MLLACFGVQVHLKKPVSPILSRVHGVGSRCLQSTHLERHHRWLASYALCHNLKRSFICVAHRIVVDQAVSEKRLGHGSVNIPPRDRPWRSKIVAILVVADVHSRDDVAQKAGVER